MTFISIRQAAQPPDRAHRYGHGKAEAIGAFVQAGFVLGSAFFLANEAVRRLLSPQPLEQSALGIAVLLLASPATAGAARIPALRGAAHRLDRHPRRQSALPQRFIHESGGDRDPPADRGHGLDAGRPAVRPRPGARAPVQCLRRRPPGARHAHGPGAAGRAARLHPRARPRAPEAQGVHDLRTRRAGSDVFIELHLELDGSSASSRRTPSPTRCRRAFTPPSRPPTSSSTRSRPASRTSAWTPRSPRPRADRNDVVMPERAFREPEAARGRAAPATSPPLGLRPERCPRLIQTHEIEEGEDCDERLAGAGHSGNQGGGGRGELPFRLSPGVRVDAPLIMLLALPGGAPATEIDRDAVAPVVPGRSTA